MIQKLKKLITHFSIASMLLIPVLAPAVAHADAANVKDNLCAGVALTVKGDCSSDGGGTGAQDKIDSILGTVINIFSLVVGVVAVIMIIIGGLKYITSGGESANITGAKNTILYAIIGLVVVALAQFIVRFVLVKVNTP